MEATHVRVTNSNDFNIDDRFDGAYYLFATGKERLVPIHAAALFFGFPVDGDGRVTLTVDEDGTAQADWEHVKRRYGWNNIIRLKDEDLGQAVQRAKEAAAVWVTKIRIEPIMMAMTIVPAGTSGDLPAPRDGATEQGETVEPALNMRGKMKAG